MGVGVMAVGSRVVGAMAVGSVMGGVGGMAVLVATVVRAMAV